MRLIAGLAAATSVYLLVGGLVGVKPRWLTRERRRVRLGTTARQWLIQADVDVAPATFAAVSIGAGVAAGFVVGQVTGVGALGLVAGLATAVLPRTVFAKRRRAIRQARLAGWPDALRDVVTHLRASMSVHASLVELGRSGPEALRDVFVRYARLSSALDHRSALEVAREELADPLSDRIIEVLLCAFDQGSSVVIDVLQELAEASTGDLQLIDEIDTAQLETRLEARGAAVMPFVVLGMLCATSDGYREFYSTRLGWVVIVAGAVMATGGLIVISRLGRIPTERRILAVGGTAGSGNR